MFVLNAAYVLQSDGPLWDLWQQEAKMQHIIRARGISNWSYCFDSSLKNTFDTAFQPETKQQQQYSKQCSNNAIIYTYRLKLMS